MIRTNVVNHTQQETLRIRLVAQQVILQIEIQQKVTISNFKAVKMNNLTLQI